MAFKYQIEAEARIKEKDWGQTFRVWRDEFECTEAQAALLVKQEFLDGASVNLKTQYDYHYKATENGIEDITQHRAWEDMPELEMPCAKSDEQEGGLYFVGMISVTPDDKKYYLVKVGSARQGIGNRVSQYAIYNPMIYHNNCCLTRSEYDGYYGEENCHWYIADRAYARAQNSHEWFYVDEETYYELCETFADKEQFRAIAEGRD